MADVAGGVEQRGSRRGLPLRQIVVLFTRSHVALHAGRGRQNCEPHYALSRPLFLQALHVAAVVLLADEGTAIVVPFEDYILSAIVREVNGFAIAG
jgi:hypothetical protein